MRHSPVAFGTLRTAVDDVEVAGIFIPAGTLLLANTAAANRDPAVYDDPDRLDITCEGPATMLTFGGGIHYCLMITLPSTLTTVDLQHGYRSSGPILGVRPQAVSPAAPESGPLSVREPSRRGARQLGRRAYLRRESRSSAGIIAVPKRVLIN
jgi:hypothetical protein